MTFILYFCIALNQQLTYCSGFLRCCSINKNYLHNFCIITEGHYCKLCQMHVLVPTISVVKRKQLMSLKSATAYIASWNSMVPQTIQHLKSLILRSVLYFYRCPWLMNSSQQCISCTNSELPALSKDDKMILKMNLRSFQAIQVSPSWRFLLFIKQPCLLSMV